ncbi:hypothetical protein RND81_03G031500 [Saponaria officinalis]|uniref:RING-type E3 ubiquitin transferase n=1 Tax=Saponaria officinalis TaxID=3572 RepID=A0AAW1LYE7_SAPOF
MQRQRSTIGSLPDSINFDYGSPTTNVGIDQQICWTNIRNPAESMLPDYRTSARHSDSLYIGSASQESRSLGIWNVGDSSSSSPQNHVSHDERLNQSGWAPPTNISVGNGMRLDVQQDEPANLVSQPGINLNLTTNHLVNRPTFVHGSSSSFSPQNCDLNEARFHRVDDMDCPDNSKSYGFESRLHLSTGTSSDPFASSSGSGGFLIEDDDSRPGCSFDGRRLNCKRKTIEENAGQSSSGGTGAEASMWGAISPTFDMPESSSNVNLPEQVNPRLVLAMGDRAPSDNVSPQNVPGGLSSSQRIYRSRVNLSIQLDSMPNNSFVPVPSSVTRPPDIVSVHQPLRFLPINPPLDLMSPIPQETSVTQNQSTLFRAPTMRRNVQSHRWDRLRAASSSSSVVPGERDGVLPNDSSSRNVPRNIGEHPMFAPSVEARNSASHPTNWSLNSGNAGISRNAGSSPRSGSNVGSHSSAGPSWASHRNPPSQYSRRLSEYVRRSLISTVESDIAGQSSSNSQQRSVPASSQDAELPSSSRNRGQSRSHSRSALWMERQGDGTGGIPYLRALAAAGEGRSRLVSEIRNALDIIRRGEGLRMEDVMILDQSAFFGMADIDDQHRDMRLDVDNMSYEELLALEERIGYVSTGLNEEKILKCMKQHKHVHTMSDDLTEAEPCCVCQEEYTDGDDIGTLDCGHDFHKECIKQWLSQKNLCPICKTTGLAT